MEKRYSVRVNDSRINNSVDAFLCRHCYNKLMDSAANRGFFKVARFTAWAKDRRDSMRRF